MYKYLSLNESAYECLVESIEALRKGWLICVPTDTVYGIICWAERPDAIQSLAAAKGRPQEKPFSLFTDSLDRIEQAGAIISSSAKQLANAFWPGPLTIVVPAKKNCPCEYDGSVGVRSPDHEFLQTLIPRFDGLLVNTSLNRSGEPPVWELKKDSLILSQLDLVLDEGKLAEKPPSTVVDCRKEQIQILREGAISRKELEEWL